MGLLATRRNDLSSFDRLDPPGFVPYTDAVRPADTTELAMERFTTQNRKKAKPAFARTLAPAMGSKRNMDAC